MWKLRKQPKAATATTKQRSRSSRRHHARDQQAANASGTTSQQHIRRSAGRVSRYAGCQPEPRRCFLLLVACWPPRPPRSFSLAQSRPPQPPYTLRVNARPDAVFFSFSTSGLARFRTCSSDPVRLRIDVCMNAFEHFM